MASDIKTILADRNREFLAREVDAIVSERKFKEKVDELSGADISLENPIIRVFILAVFTLIMIVIVRRL